MSSSQVRTEVLVSARTKGFTEAQAQAAKLTQTAAKSLEAQTKGFTHVDKEVKKLTEELKQATKQQIVLTQALQGASKGTAVYKVLAQQLGQANQQAVQLRSTIQNLNQVYKEQHVHQQAFAQGFVQGVLPMPHYLQRGHGMFSQAAGIEAGHSLRHIGHGMISGLAGAPMSGIEGIREAVGAIPLVGGAASGLLGMTAQYGERALAFRQQRFKGLPFLSGAESQGRANMDAAEKRASAAGLSMASIESQANAAGERARPSSRSMLGSAFSAMMPSGSPFGMMGPRGTVAVQDPDQVRKEEKARLMAKRSEMFRGTETIQGMGAEFGMAGPQAHEMALTLAKMGGGTGKELMSQGGTGGFFRKAAAASVLGIGGETSGAFLQAQRSGGLFGAKIGQAGTANKELERTWQQASEMGLEGSGVVGYLEKIASGIEDWKNTGIPINSDSISKFGGELRSEGFSGARATNIAFAANASGQQLAQRGLPSNLTDITMLQAAGFKGGGAADLLQARMKLESGEWMKNGGASNAVRSMIKKGGGGAAGLQFAFSKMGGALGMGSITEFASQFGGMGGAEGEALKKQAQAAIKAGQARSKRGMEATATALMKTPEGQSAEHAARIQNEQLAAGEKIIPGLEALEQATTELAGMFSQKLSGSVNKLSEALEHATKKALDLAFGESQ